MRLLAFCVITLVSGAEAAGLVRKQPETSAREMTMASIIEADGTIEKAAAIHANVVKAAAIHANIGQMVMRTGKGAIVGANVPTSPPSCEEHTSHRGCLPNLCGWDYDGRRCRACESSLDRGTCHLWTGCKWFESSRTKKKEKSKWFHRSKKMLQKEKSDEGCHRSMNMFFGGAQHASHGQTISRPEDIQSQTCFGGTCTECTKEVGCWHGSGRHDLVVTVPANTDSAPVDRIAALWVQCPTGGARWTLKVTLTENCEVDVVLDGKTTGTLKLEPGSNRASHDLNMGAGDHHIKLVMLRITDLAQDASVIAELSVSGVQGWMDVCMGKKLCLRELGDKSPESFKLRNSNLKQRACLTGQPEAKDKKKCKAWDNCMKTQEDRKQPQKPYKEILKALLVAATSRKGGRRQRRKRRKGGDLLAQLRTQECIDPDSADAEAIECECFADLQKACGNNDDMEACFKSFYCAHKDVCCSWKEDNCAADTIKHCPNTGSLSLMTARSIHQENSSSHHEVTVEGDSIGGLDATTLGKCAV